MNLVIALAATFLIVYAGLQVMYAFRKYKMHKKEKEFIESGSGPYGSALCHGMVLNSDKNVVVRDSRKSQAWYSRLV